MTSAEVVETSVNVTSNSPSQDYTHPDDHNLRTSYKTVINLSKVIKLFFCFAFYSMGAPVMVELEGQTDPLQIAMKELK